MLNWWSTIIVRSCKKKSKNNFHSIPILVLSLRKTPYLFYRTLFDRKFKRTYFSFLLNASNGAHGVDNGLKENYDSMKAPFQEWKQIVHDMWKFHQSVVNQLPQNSYYTFSGIVTADLNRCIKKELEAENIELLNSLKRRKTLLW